MATFTADPALENDLGTTTTTTLSWLGSPGTVQNVTGLDPLGDGQGPRAQLSLTGQDGDGRGYTLDSTLSLLGPAGVVQNVTGLDPLGDGMGPRASVVREGMDDVGSMIPGVLIPSAYFRRVLVHVEDEEGQPITNALHLVADDAFPTAASVDDDGDALIYLLRVGYEEFYLAGDFGLSDAYELTWYESEGNPDRESGVDEVTLRFDTNAPTSGLDLTTSVKFR